MTNFDFSSIFNPSLATSRQKPAKKTPQPVVNSDTFEIKFNVASAVSGHRGHTANKTVKATGPKFARETFWDKYNKETLKALREQHGSELVNFYMMEKTLEEMEQKFDMQ